MRAAYCNWLSKQAGIPRDEWCYVPNDKGQYAQGMRVVPDFVKRSGYRLPTALEWEYACRAGSVTRWSFGEAEDLLPKYAWGQSNSWSRLHPVGTLRPNDLGLFDMYGNAWEWCQDAEDSAAATGPAAPDGVVTDAVPRVARGGAFGHGTLTMQSSNDIAIQPSQRGGDLGFRTGPDIPVKCLATQVQSYMLDRFRSGRARIRSGPRGCRKWCNAVIVSSRSCSRSTRSSFWPSGPTRRSRRAQARDDSRTPSSASNAGRS